MTEKIAAEASLTETSHLLRLVVEHLPARVSYWDRDMHIRFANPAFLEWRGGTQDSIMGKHVSEILDAPYLALIQPCIDRALAGEQSSLEAVSTLDDGVRQVMDVHFEPDCDGEKVNGLIVLALDITEQRAAERELARQQQRYEMLVEDVRDYAVYMLDPAGRITTWNSGAQRIKGYQADEVIGRPFGLFFTDEDRDSKQPERQLARAGAEGRFETQAWRCRRDGSRFWAGVVMTALHDENHELVGFAKLTRDLTEHRRQQDLLARVAELAPCAMLMVDAAGLIQMVNAEAQRVFEYARAELIGKPVEMLMPQRHQAAHVGLRQGFLRAASARPMGAGRELAGLRKSGEEFPIEIGLSPIESPDGTNTLAAVFDVTAQRAAQRETERSLAEKETLLRELYHRVKNNLQVVQSLLTLQRHSLPEGVARTALEESVQRVRAMSLVHEMLYQSGNLTAVSLEAYTRDLLRQIADSHGTAGRQVHMISDVPNIETGLDNAVPFGLLVTELVSNCLKHAFPDGRGGTVRVSIARQSDGDLLTVADDGVGFATDFDPNAISKTMGLQLAGGLARQLGGAVQARCDGGAVFSALLKRL